MSGTTTDPPQRKRYKYVHSFEDKTGRWRHYFQRKRTDKGIALPGVHGSPEFVQAWRACMAGEYQPPQRRAFKGEIIPGSVRAAVLGYLDSSAFKALAGTTQRTRRYRLLAFCEIRDKNGRRQGDKQIRAIEWRHVDKWIAGMTEKPGAAHNFLRALRGMFKYAIKAHMRPDDPSQGVTLPRKKPGGGWHTWVEREIQQFERRFPLGTKQRLVLVLALYLLQRCETIARLGPQHLEDGRLVIRPSKTENTTEVELSLPLHPMVVRALKMTPTGHLAFVVTKFGTLYKPQALGKYFKRACVMAGLPHCSIHGLRKAGCRRLIEDGASLKQVAALTGHKDLKSLQVYLEGAEQEVLADGAIEIMTQRYPDGVKTGTRSGKPRHRFATYGSKSLISPPK